MLSLFLPHICISCNDSSVIGKRSTVEGYLCERCKRILDSSEPPQELDIRARLEQVLDRDTISFVCSAYSFQDESVTQQLVHSVKYIGMPHLGKVLGRSLATQYQNIGQQFDFLIPVPLHRTRHAERGFNQAEALSLGLVDYWKETRLLHTGVVKRTRPTRTQTELTISERVENVRGAFGLNPKHTHTLTGKRLLLIDDVLTTGATLASLAETLLPAQPKSIGFLTFAAAERST